MPLQHYPGAGGSRSARSCSCRSATCWDATLPLALPLLSGLVPHFGEDAEDMTRDDLRGRADPVLFTVPRYLQKLASRSAGRRAERPARPKRLVYDWAMHVGRPSRTRANWEGLERLTGPGGWPNALAPAVRLQAPCSTRARLRRN